MRSDYLFTSESVSEGHPDKVADQISDAVVDLFLSKDPVARVACETMVTTNRIILAGEVRSAVPVSNEEIEAAARATVRRIGYEQHGFHWNRAEFACHLHEQSAHIAQGVDEGGNKDEGAGDQGIMFGYACDETPDLMPATLYYSHRILERLAADRHGKVVDFLEPDAKSQVTLQYEGGKPVRATALVVSTQHSAALSSDAGQARLRDYVKGVFAEVLPRGWLPGDEAIFVNPTGLFEIGGPPGSPAARSSSTPMAARLPMAAAHSPARTPPRSTVRRPISAAISPRTSSRRGSRRSARSSSAMRSASPSRCRSMSTRTAPARWTKRGSKRLCRGSCASPPRASAPIFSSTSRSTSGLRATAISAARLKATSSPGRRPIWSTR
jgi:hypothetical protein